jgi:hypothetical protein
MLKNSRREVTVVLDEEILVLHPDTIPIPFGACQMRSILNYSTYMNECRMYRCWTDCISSVTL